MKYSFLRNKMDSQHKIKWTLYISLASVFIFVSVSEVGPFCSVRRHILASLQQEPSLYKYVIVFDGGSTGTRIHIFAFANSTDDHMTLKNEYFEEVKPGLSSYADNPSKAANSVLHLLEKAKAVIPPSNWDDTPVTLKATAGLRLLPSSLSDAILEAISKAFQNSPFLCDENSVGILDGEDEGLYAWYTVNFLLGRLCDASHSVALLDLGGGSTQVTFTPVELDTFFRSPKEYIVLAKIQNKTLPIYTHSYLGLGLMSARLSILHLSSDNPEGSSMEMSFSSACIHPHRKFIWKHDLKEYNVRGRKDKTFGFKECYQKAVEFLGETVDQAKELQSREIYALSYYFDRAVDLGIIGTNGGLSSVGEFMHACEKVCSEKEPKGRFLCLDCSYISALLHHGLGFSVNKELKMEQQIDGIETSWGLGAAFSMLR